MGIDYGEKRVGVAISDERGVIAFPRATLPNDRALLSSVLRMVQDANVAAVVVGDSRNARGEENAIMEKARRFVKDLERESAVRVFFEPEFYTSVEARRDTGKPLVDAEAAAIILNSYITRIAP